MTHHTVLNQPLARPDKTKNKSANLISVCKKYCKAASQQYFYLFFFLCEKLPHQTQFIFIQFSFSTGHGTTNQNVCQKQPLPLVKTSSVLRCDVAKFVVSEFYCIFKNSVVISIISNKALAHFSKNPKTVLPYLTCNAPHANGMFFTGINSIFETQWTTPELVDRRRCVYVHLQLQALPPHTYICSRKYGIRWRSLIVARSTLVSFLFCKIIRFGIVPQIVHVNHSEWNIVKFNNGRRRDRDYSVLLKMKRAIQCILKNIYIFKKSNILK